MWLREIAIGGLMFSPFLFFLGCAAALTVASAWALRLAGLQHRVWKDAWFYLSLFTCYVALSLKMLG